MKFIACALSLCAMTGIAHAGDFMIEQSASYLNVEHTPGGIGFGVTLDYVKNTNQGSAGGLGLEFALPLGPLTAAVGVKALSLDPSTSRVGVAALTGARINLDLPHDLSIFGQDYYAPSSAASGGFTSVNDARAGIRWNPVPLFSVEAGFRYFKIGRSNNQPDVVLADGPFVGAGLSF